MADPGERNETPGTSPRSLVLGLTGPNAAGKGEVARILGEMGYTYHSLSDLVREEAAERGEEPIRETLIRIGRELRRRHGPNVLAERIRERLEAPCLVDSVRNPAEVEELRSIGGFYLLGVTAPPEIRLERMRERGRPGDPVSEKEFREKERIENSSDVEGQRLGATLALADRVVRNEGTLDALEAEVRAAVDDLLERDRLQRMNLTEEE